MAYPMPLGLTRRMEERSAQSVTESLLELRQTMHRQVQQSSDTTHSLGETSLTWLGLTPSLPVAPFTGGLCIYQLSTAQSTSVRLPPPPAGWV